MEHPPAGVVTIISAGHVIPVRPRGEVLSNHSVVVADDAVAAVLPTAEAHRAWPDADHVDLPGHVVLPGLINAHTHSPMTLLRGYADDIELNRWLKDHIWPAEQAHVGSEFVRDGTRLAIVEMLRSGTTCFNDMYFFADATIEACLEAGMRASAGLIIVEFASAWAENADAYFERGQQLHQRYAHENLISFTLAPHAPYTVSDETLGRIADRSAELELPVHMHLLETEWEIRQSEQLHGMHPVSRLERHGLLNHRLQAVHMTQLSAADIERFSAAGGQVVHCPQSNLKLASGLCPLAALLDAGINVALGTDGAASNNDLDMLAEAQTAALLAKGLAGDAQAVDAFQALEMMTINAARALGMESRLGTWSPASRRTCARSTWRPRRPSRSTMSCPSWCTPHRGARSAMSGSPADVS
jgi:5-methylthioadenosine/S-adenosylhomocysteine deaminase